MPNRCEVVVQTDHGRTRCSNNGILSTRGEIARGIPTEICSFHRTHSGNPQCVGPASETDGSRCPDVAVIPPENPQFCTEHNPSYNRPAVVSSRPRWIDENVTVEGYQTTPFVIDDPRDPVQDEVSRQERADQEHADAMTFAEQARAFWDDHVVVNHGLDRVEVSMPSVNFSQTAIPFVAALVERLGGEVVVPARQMRNNEVLRWERTGTGLQFQIRRGSEVVRNNSAPMPTAPQVVTPLPPVEERKYVVERVIDEEDLELRKLLLRCEECGLQFEKTHKTARGTDECPYCTVRLFESAGKSSAMQSEIERLRGIEQVHQRDGIAYATKIARLEQMVQQKIDAVNEKSTEVRTLREALERRGIATGSTPLPRPPQEDRATLSPIERIRELRALNPGMGLLEARVRVDAERAGIARPADPVRLVPRSEIPPRGGVRERVELVAREFGGQVQRHAMTVDHPGMRGYEVHSLEFVIPLQSHLNPSEDGPERSL